MGFKEEEEKDLVCFFGGGGLKVFLGKIRFFCLGFFWSRGRRWLCGFLF